MAVLSSLRSAFFVAAAIGSEEKTQSRTALRPDTYTFVSSTRESNLNAAVSHSESHKSRIGSSPSVPIPNDGCSEAIATYGRREERSKISSSGTMIEKPDTLQATLLFTNYGYNTVEGGRQAGRSPRSPITE